MMRCVYRLCQNEPPIHVPSTGDRIPVQEYNDATCNDPCASCISIQQVEYNWWDLQMELSWFSTWSPSVHRECNSARWHQSTACSQRTTLVYRPASSVLPSDNIHRLGHRTSKIGSKFNSVRKMQVPGCHCVMELEQLNNAGHGTMTLSFGENDKHIPIPCHQIYLACSGSSHNFPEA